MAPFLMSDMPRLTSIVPEKRVPSTLITYNVSAGGRLPLALGFDGAVYFHVPANSAAPRASGANRQKHIKVLRIVFSFEFDGAGHGPAVGPRH
jgi:hypothetical protein